MWNVAPAFGYATAAVVGRLGLALLPRGLLVHHQGVTAVAVRRPAVPHRVELLHPPGRAGAVRALTESR